VIAAGAETNAAKIGDLWLHWAKRIGVAGIVCDGLVRDVVGLLKADLPVFARGIAPNAGYKTGPGAINAEVSCGGVAIAPGDIVVGDRDGVVAIPRTQAAAVAKQVELVKQKEAAAEKSIRRGVKLQFWDEMALGERVRYVD
jgi:regulator of RNase E activity RraA